ncbi:hypothetical protein ABC795_11220 [Blastococcus sp. HT6-30]|uniref:hypothetical protein n=1 Tax=Blastococcus sp. HT6-30 TaxID=3144843 RepID=UPI00321B54AB
MTTTDTSTTEAGTEMTDASQTDTTAPEGTNPPEGTEEGQQSAANREAANYRRKLRDAEAERDALASAVATYQKRDAEALVGERLLSAADLWVAGVELKDLLDDGATVSAEKVDAAVAKVLEDHPHWAPKKPGVPRDMGQGSRGESVGGGTSWASVISGGRRS